MRPKWDVATATRVRWVTGQEVLPYIEKQVMEQANFTSSPLGKAWEKTNRKTG